jgi:hypothetical protein
VTVSMGDPLAGLRVGEVSADRIKIMALVLRDTNSIRLDVEAVAAAGLGDREVNEGGLTMGYAQNIPAGWAASRASRPLAGQRVRRGRLDVGGTVLAAERAAIRD